jgi:hypothetical protein
MKENSLKRSMNAKELERGGELADFDFVFLNLT